MSNKTIEQRCTCPKHPNGGPLYNSSGVCVSKDCPVHGYRPSKREVLGCPHGSVYRSTCVNCLNADIERLTAERAGFAHIVAELGALLPLSETLGAMKTGATMIAWFKDCVAERDRLRAALEGVVAAYIDGAKAMVIIAREALAGAAIQHKLNCNSLQPCDCGALTGGEK